MQQNLAYWLREYAKIWVIVALDQAGADDSVLDVIKMDDARKAALARRSAGVQNMINTLVNRAAISTTRDAARQAQGQVIATGAVTTFSPVRDEAIATSVRQREIRLKELLNNTRDTVLAEMQDVIIEGTKTQVSPTSGAVVRPTIAEVAQRINRQYFGGQGGQPVGEPTLQPTRTVLPTFSQRVQTEPGKQSILTLFSPERAELIARTELNIAENEGIVEGYKSTGVKRLEWIAYDDGRTGVRRHNEMNGKTIEVGGMFTMPDGAKMRFPGDPNGPIRHLANCRCTVVPVFD